MSGRDYRSFITNHRADEMDRLVRRFTNGVGSNKYDHNVDYNKLKNLTNQKKFASHKTLVKVQKIEQLSKQSKENNLLKQHRLVWQKEFLHLNHMRKKNTSDMDIHMRENCFGSLCRQIYSDFQYETAGLESQFDHFKKATVEPVWDLRDDLKYWLIENRAELRLGVPEIIEHHSDIVKTITSVKQQQSAVIKQLQLEQMSLEADIQSAELSEMCPSHLEKRPKFIDGIPVEAYDLECSDEKLKLAVLEEFLILDQKYYALLSDLDQRHHLTISNDAYGGWDGDKNFQFVSVYEQYPSELQNRRTLLMDRLKRQFPKVRRADIIEHENWWLDYKHYNERQKAVMVDWMRDRRELMVKARVVFAEAMAAHELEERKGINRENQREICDALYQKVWEWREKKLEAMALEAELEKHWAEEIAEQREAEEEREKQRRDYTKKKIDKFQERKQQKRLELEKLNRQRLEELKSTLEEQANFDKERVKYREDQLEIHREEKQRLKEQRLVEEEEKNQRLEHLREQVRPDVEYDPQRVFQSTEAWHAHLTDEQEDEEALMTKPLFEINTFTAQQVTCDPRVRLEQRLRDAGLHTNDYARQMMAQAKPLHPPRRDMESTVFKQ